jgi:hypothetical protein
VRQSCWRFYIRPFDDAGAYADWIEVTNDVEFNSLGTLSQQLDNTEFDIGVYRNANVAVTLRNDHGRYADVNVLQSIFRYKRSDSLLKITWEMQQEAAAYCGTAILGDAYLSEEVDVFTGLISDESLSMDVEQLKVPFQVLGREVILEREIVPFGSIAAGELISSVIFKCLNQAKITALLNVSEANIAVGTDVALDVIDSLQGKTVKDAVTELMRVSNSVLRIEGDSIIVSPRTPSATVAFYFYGQASTDGAENIDAITEIKTGLSRTFNYMTWKDSNAVGADADSVIKFGHRTKEFSSALITSQPKQAALMDGLISEFGQPRQEFLLETPLNYGSLAVKHLDRVSVDYPTVYVAGDSPMPICGIAICGQAVLPKGLWAFTVDPLDHYKITGRSVDLRKAIIKFRLRKI